LEIPQRVRLVEVVESECRSAGAIKRLDNEEKEKDKEADNQLNYIEKTGFITYRLS
jgi:hypothetical protein